MNKTLKKLEDVLKKYNINPSIFWDDIPKQYWGLFMYNFSKCNDIEKMLRGNGYV